MHNHIHKRMHKMPKALKVLLFLVFAVLAAAAVGFGVMYLWNWLMPGLFGLKAIGYWQALGLCVLGRVLFGGWGIGHRRGGHWKHRLAERWMQMTPEEREALSSRWGHHHDHSTPDSTL